MRRVYAAMCVILLAFVFLVGLVALCDIDAEYSEIEGRYLAVKPKYSFGALLDGSYVQSFRSYFSDTFPAREALLEDFSSWDWVYTLVETQSDAESAE